MIADVFIVGAGPAGLAAALAARRKGFSVTVADSAHVPVDKACGELVMPAGIAALAELGVRVDAPQSFPVPGVRFVDSGLEMEASFPGGVAQGIRRVTLHRLLVDQAEAAGITMLWGAQIDGLITDGVRVDGQLIPCRWIIGADGEDSRVRAWAALTAQWRHRRRFGFRRHYRIEPWTDFAELYWGETCQIRVTQIGEESVCVAALSQDAGFGLDDALAEVPELEERLRGREVPSTELRAVSASRKLVDVQRGSVGLIGDASGSVDAIAGEGLGTAFRQAVALADALEQGDLSFYQEAYGQIGERVRRFERILLALARHPGWRRAAMRRFAANPNILSALLSNAIFG